MCDNEGSSVCVRHSVYEFVGLLGLFGRFAVGMVLGGCEAVMSYCSDGFRVAEMDMGDKMFLTMV